MSNFRKEIAKLPRDGLLGAIAAQDAELYKQVTKIEAVYQNKCKSPFTNQWKLSNDKLALLLDDPEEYDVVKWLRLRGHKPRAYQIMVMRDPSQVVVAPMGRRLGKTTTLASIAAFESTIKKKKVLVIAPMNAQAELIQEEFLKLTGNHMPNNITFMATNKKYGTVKGFKPDVIIADEVDYMKQDDLDSLYVMLQKTSPNDHTRLYITGTPNYKGSESHMFKLAGTGTASVHWFPSYVSPYWTEDTEKMFKKEYSAKGYSIEIEAKPYVYST